MKRTLSLSLATLGVAVLNVSAQTYGNPEIHFYAGLTITGAVGKVYSISYATNLPPAGESDWRCLDFLRLPASPYLWTDKSAPATGRRFYWAKQFPTPTNMAFIPPGTFRMGSAKDEVHRWDDEGPQTEVTISRGFWIGKYEVTQMEYAALMGTNPSWFNGDRTGQSPSVDNDWKGLDYGSGQLRPVEQVSWNDAVAYCAALTERERAAGRIPLQSSYRLPTEAEWEYACRAWTSTRFSYGDDASYTNLTDNGWYWDNSDGMTHGIGRKSPNPWGLFDMHGNVLEWCLDKRFGSLSDRLIGGIAVDPTGPRSGAYRVLRGGSWRSLDWACRSGQRDWGKPDEGDFYIGFRTVLDAGRDSSRQNAVVWEWKAVVDLARFNYGTKDLPWSVSPGDEISGTFKIDYTDVAVTPHPDWYRFCGQDTEILTARIGGLEVWSFTPDAANCISISDQPSYDPERDILTIDRSTAAMPGYQGAAVGSSVLFVDKSGRALSGPHIPTDFRLEDYDRVSFGLSIIWSEAAYDLEATIISLQKR